MLFSVIIMLENGKQIIEFSHKLLFLPCRYVSNVKGEKNSLCADIFCALSPFHTNISCIIAFGVVT